MQFFLISALAATSFAAPVAQPDLFSPLNPFAAITPPLNVSLPNPPEPAVPAASAAPIVSPAPVPADPAPAAPSAAPAQNPAPSPANAACSRAINRLAAGIQKNIAIQQNESATLDAILKLLDATTNGTLATALTFAPMKQRLISEVDQGIIQRQQNQVLSPLGNQADAGLQVTGDAQLMELVLAGFLTGNKAQDTNTVQSLQLMVASGVKQNLQNLLDATQGCVPTDAAAKQGLQTAQQAGLKAVAISAK